MPVSGLVVTLSHQPPPRAEAITLIGREPRITVGALEANRLAVVVDTASSEEDRQLWDWLDALSGVSRVEVAFVGFEEQSELLPESACLPERAGQVSSATQECSTFDAKDN